MEEELVRKAKSGNFEAFSQLIMNNKNTMYKIAKCRLNREEDISDVIQDTIIIAFNSIKRLRNIKAFKIWIIKILINNCNNFYKKNKKIESISIETNEMEKYLIGEEDISPDIYFESLICCLNKEEKTILMLFYGGKYTIKEISKILNIKENTIKSKIARSKQKIKNVLDEER